jgi:hypothetical protein
MLLCNLVKEIKKILPGHKAYFLLALQCYLEIPADTLIIIDCATQNMLR